VVESRDGRWVEGAARRLPGVERGIGEIRRGRRGDAPFLATIEPMHGTEVAVYLEEGGERRRHLLDDGYRDGHALAVGDLLGLGRDQVVAGWRVPDAEGSVGIRMYIPADRGGREWRTHVIDHGGMATEDLVLADLDGDGRLDIVAAGRATRNLKIYWNRTEPATR
jgi:hypothetical protein